MAETRVAEVVVPQIFTPYVQQLTERKNKLIESGAIAVDSGLSAMLQGAGLTFNVPSWQDIPNDADNVGGDDPGVTSTPNDLATSQEIAVRLNRNQSWKNMDLVAELSGSDPANTIANRVATYWSHRLQAAALATLAGVFADNDAAPAASEHTEDDLTLDVSAGGFLLGTTNFQAENFINASALMGDSADDLDTLCVHSMVYATMQKNNLIDFIPDSEGRVNIPTFLGRRVVRDDSMPNPSSGIYHSYILGRGALKFGRSTPKNATAVAREEAEGNGQGSETLYNRVVWAIHPVGHKFAVASPAVGGPSNATTSGNLGHADSWVRVYPERKQIKIVRLITRES